MAMIDPQRGLERAVENVRYLYVQDAKVARVEALTKKWPPGHALHGAALLIERALRDAP